jgi:hypothetical protein
MTTTEQIGAGKYRCVELVALVGPLFGHRFELQRCFVGRGRIAKPFPIFRPPPMYHPLCVLLSLACSKIKIAVELLEGLALLFFLLLCRGFYFLLVFSPPDEEQ